jgi:hypothetical protein
MSPQRERIALAFLSALLLLPVSMTNAAPDEPLCLLAPSEMPSAWKRWGDAPKSISERPWSDVEKADVAYALRKGLDELETYYAQHPSAIYQLGDDAAASFFEIGLRPEGAARNQGHRTAERPTRTQSADRAVPAQAADCDGLQ